MAFGPQGFNSTVMAFGQTGAGKTNTCRNLIPRFFKGVFELFSGDEDVKCWSEEVVWTAKCPSGEVCALQDAAVSVVSMTVRRL